MFFKKRKNKCETICHKKENLSNKANKKFIFFFGSEFSAADVEGNIVIDNNIPYIICGNGKNEEITWEKIKDYAKNISLPAFYWVKNINAQNYEDYTYTYDGAQQPKNELLTNMIRVFVFPITTAYSEAVMDIVYVNPKNSQPYIVHSVANGHGWHEPYFVSRYIKITFEDIREICKKLELTKYLDIDENNWQQFVGL